MDRYTHGRDGSYASSSGGRTGSLLSRTFTSRTRRSPSREPAEDVKGPLGLTTLYDPAEPAITDLVFVHGLGGGSRSTWAKDADSFWPQDWLPEDDAFQQVRIHTFGYNSSWDKSSTLNIHDFAKSLLGSLYDCPQIPRGSTVWPKVIFRTDVTSAPFSYGPMLKARADADSLGWTQHGWLGHQEGLYSSSTDARV